MKMCEEEELRLGCVYGGQAGELWAASSEPPSPKTVQAQPAATRAVLRKGHGSSTRMHWL